MNTGFTQSTIEQPATKIENLDAARVLFQRIKSMPGSDRYISHSLEALHASSPFCALKALDSILRSDASIRPQNFVDKTIFKHKPTQDFIEKLQHLSAFISETYGLQVANKISCFSMMDTLSDTLKADTARLEHILRASDDTLSHYMSENYDIKVLLHKRKVLNAATSISRSILALKSTTLLIDQLLHKRDLVNAIAIFYLADVAIRTSRTVLVDVESMREGLKRDHERLSYQLKHQIMALFYGKGTVSSISESFTRLNTSPSVVTKTGAPGLNGTSGADSLSTQDIDVLSSLLCISDCYSMGLYKMIQNLSFLPLCTFLRSIVARAYQTTDLIQSFIDSLGVLKDIVLEKNPFFSIIPSQETLIKNSTINTMPPELYSILLGQCLLMLYESDIASGRISEVSNFMKVLLAENIDSRLIEMYHRSEQESSLAENLQASSSNSVTDKLSYISSSLNLHKADHIMKLRRLILSSSGGFKESKFRTIHTQAFKDFAVITRHFFRRTYFSMINIVLFYGSFLVSYSCYLKSSQTASPFDRHQSQQAQQQYSSAAQSLIKTLQSSKSKAVLPPAMLSIETMSTMSTPYPSTLSPNQPAQAEHVSFKKIIEILFFMLAETSPSFALDFVSTDVDASLSAVFSDTNAFISSFSANTGQNRLLSTSFSSTTPTGKLMKSTEQIPFIDIIFSLDAKYPFIGSDFSLKQWIGIIYDAAIRRLAHYCSMVIKTSGYVKPITTAHLQTCGDKHIISGQDSIYNTIGASISEQDGRVVADTATSSLFNLAWLGPVSIFISSTGVSKSMSSIKPDNWNALFIENYLLSFYYCTVLLTNTVRINPIDELFTQFFSKVLVSYTSNINTASATLFSLVTLKDLELGFYTANSRVRGLAVLSTVSNLQQLDDDGSYYSTCDAPSESTDVLTSTTGLLRIESSYSLARALLGDERVIRSDRYEFNAYKLTQHTLRFLNDMMAFSLMSSKYYEANSFSVLNTVCNMFLNMIYMRMHMHYKYLYSYALLFTPAGNVPIEGSTVSSYETLLDDYISSGSVTSDKIAILDKALGQHGVEQYVNMSTFRSLGTFAILNEIIDNRQSMDDVSTLVDISHNTLDPSNISARSSVGKAFNRNSTTASIRQSRTIDAHDRFFKQRSHSRQQSYTQGLDDDIDHVGVNFTLDGHSTTLGEDFKEAGRSSMRHSQRPLEKDTVPEKLPNAVLVDGNMLEHALYCLQGCILIYDYLKKLSPTPPTEDNTWYSRFELTIHKILRFIILEWRLYVSVHIRQGFDEDLGAPQEHVQLGAQYSVSSGYNSVVSSIKGLRLLTEGLDFKWIMDYNKILFDHIFYTVERVFTEKLSRISSSVLRTDQMSRMMAALQYISTVTTGPVSFRSVFQKLHSLCT